MNILYTGIQCCTVVFYRCETLLSTLREERRLRVLENRVLRIIFGTKNDEVTRERRKLRNEELNDLYSLSSIVRVIKSRKMRWAGHVARMGDRRDVCRGFVGKPEGKRPLGRFRRRWEDNINHLTPNGHFSGRTAPLTYRCCIF
jgi:hypothetical protein